MWVSPAEPPALRALGTINSECERHGADFLLFTSHGLVAVQRKRVDDLVASLHDGRIARELAQLTNPRLARAVLVVEGYWDWDQQGVSQAIHTRWTRQQWHGIQLTVQHQGIWLVRTDSLDDTAGWLIQATTWFDKAEHVSLAARPKAQTGVWADHNRAWWVHLLQSFDGISVKTAGAIYDQARRDKIDLLEWQVDADWFLTVPGVGRKRAETLTAAFRRT